MFGKLFYCQSFTFRIFRWSLSLPWRMDLHSSMSFFLNFWFLKNFTFVLYFLIFMLNSYHLNQWIESDMNCLGFSDQNWDFHSDWSLYSENFLCSSLNSQSFYFPKDYFSFIYSSSKKWISHIYKFFWYFEFIFCDHFSNLKYWNLTICFATFLKILDFPKLSFYIHLSVQLNLMTV